MNSPEKTITIKRTARVAGVLYLVIFIAVPFAGVARSMLIIPGDAGATADNILASESLFRIGMVGETIVFLVEIVLAAILYVLLRPVSRPLSLAAALARSAEAVVQAVNLIPSIFVLLLVSGAGYLTVFDPDQLDALVLLFLDVYDTVILVWGFFFGLHLLLLGYLVYKSGYFPRILGILLVLSSLGYLIESSGNFLLPQYAELYSTIVLVLGVLGELAFTGYLLWKGLNVEKWEERALEST